jgi:hypothetical protein
MNKNFMRPVGPRSVGAIFGRGGARPYRIMNAEPLFV